MATISPAPPDRSRHSYLNDLVARSGAIGMSVYYRLAPEHKLPAAYDDAWAALRWAVTLGEDPWLLEHADLSRVFLAGCNADANIAHDTAVRVSAAGVAIRVCCCKIPPHPDSRKKLFVSKASPEGSKPETSKKLDVYAMAAEGSRK
eukprot:XP_020393228.1 probable carboxylesterase 3 [Zea mays]